MSKPHPIALSVDALLARSRALTGIDRVDHEVVEPLRILHRSLNEEAQLHATGAVAFERKLLHLLCIRLRMQRDLARHPEIHEEPLKAPVFVLGMARSGTTKMQKILGAALDFNSSPFWTNYHPALLTGSRAESTAPRIREADAWCRWFAAESPDSKYGHPFETHEPEEQTVMIESCFRSSTFFGWAHVPSYLQWVSTQSPRPMFEYLRDCLRYQQWQGLGERSKPWLIKSPIFYGLERELLAVFPDARIVMTHRSPLETLPSTLRLLECFHRPYDSAAIPVEWFEAGFAVAINRHLDLRAAGVIAPLDLHFDEIKGSALQAVEKTYRFAGMALSDAARERMRRWESEHPLHKAGKFQYSLEAYGLDADRIRHDFSRYCSFIESLKKRLLMDVVAGPTERT